MRRAVLGLGSNVGDRLANLREAAKRIGAVARVLGRSRVYESAAMGGPPQGDFLNAAVCVDWTRDPRALLSAMLAIERDLGRTRGVGDVRWGPRTIDIDVLWIEGIVVDDPGLVVPHARLEERPFALAPLLDVAPDAEDPRSGRAYVLAETDRGALRVWDQPGGSSSVWME